MPKHRQVFGVNAQTGSSYTLALSDAGKIVEFTPSEGVYVTIPTNASVAFPVGTEIKILSLNSATVSVDPDEGVTLKPWALEWTVPDYHPATLLKVGTNTWMVYDHIDLNLVV